MMRDRGTSTKLKRFRFAFGRAVLLGTALALLACQPPPSTGAPLPGSQPPPHLPVVPPDEEPVPPADFVPITPLVAPADAGTVGGDLVVGPSGSLGYRIPIPTPPGPGGLQPSLELAYDSRGGYGNVGIGWSLGGLSRIEWCPRRHDIDGVKRGVKYDLTFDEQPFCLDGRRLVRVTPFPPPDAPAPPFVEYRTTPDEHVRVTRRPDGNDQLFEVHQLDGITKEYTAFYAPRRTEEAANTVQETDVRVTWLLTRVIDRRGRSIEYKYETRRYGVGESQRLLRSIEYANGSRRLQFDYESDPARAVTWRDGVGERIGARLKGIAVEAPITDSLERRQVRLFRLKYNTGSGGQSLLRAVEECGARVDQCKPETTFEYRDAPLELVRHGIGELGVVSDRDFFADVNGDGFADRIYDCGNAACLSVGRGRDDRTKNFAFSPGEIIRRSSDNTGVAFDDIKAVADRESDGRSDLFLADEILTHSAFTHFSSTESYGDPGPYYPLTRYETGDFDGDGLLDLVGTNHEEIWIGGMRNAPTFNEQVAGTILARGLQVADLYGNGVDGVALGGEYYDATDFRRGGIPEGTSLLLGEIPRLVDLNGDGISDLSFGPDVSLGTGTAEFIPLGPVDDSDTPVHIVRAGDINGDGRGDLVIHRTWSDTFDIYWSRPLTGRPPDLTIPYPSDATVSTLRLVDLDSDGRLEILVFADGEVRDVYRSTAVGTPVMTGVRNGVGRIDTVTYASIADRDVHTPRFCDAPQVCPVKGLEVVARVATEEPAVDGIESGRDLRWTNFRYEGATFDNSGVGFVGMARRVAEHSSGLYEIIEYDVGLRMQGWYPLRGRTQRAIRFRTYTNGDSPTRVRLTRTVEHYYIDVGMVFDVRNTRTELDVYDGFYSGPSSALLQDDEIEQLIGRSTTIRIRSEDVVRSSFFHGVPRSVRRTVAGSHEEHLSRMLELRRGVLVATSETSTDTTAEGTTATVSNRYQHNEIGEVIRVEKVAPSTNGGEDLVLNRTNLGYNAEGLLVRVDYSGEGATPTWRRFGYDISGTFLRWEMNALQQVQWYGYHPVHGQLVAHAGLSGSRYRWSTDPFGRVTSVASPAFGTVDVTLKRGPGDSGTSVTLEHAGTTTTTLTDALGRTYRTIEREPSGTGREVMTRWDEQDRLVEQTAPRRVGDQWRLVPAVEMSYDRLGRIETLERAGEPPVRYQYDLLADGSQTVKELSPTSFPIHTEYRPDGRVRSVERLDCEDQGCTTPTSSAITAYAYGPFGRLESVDSPSGRFEWRHDIWGRVERKVRPGLPDIVTHYDGFARVRQEIEGPRETAFEYDVLHRVRRTLAQDETVDFGWDSFTPGALHTVDSTSGIRRAYEVDEYGRTNVSAVRFADGEELSLGFAFDDLGRLDRIDYPNTPAGEPFSVSLGYAGDRATSATETLADRTSPIWRLRDIDVWGQPASWENGNGTVTSRSLDPEAPRVTDLTVTGPGGSLVDIRYAYGPDGELSSTSYDRDSRIESFGYTRGGSLTEWTVSDGSERILNRVSYRGNFAGRVPEQRTELSGATEVFAHNTDGRVAAVDVDGVRHAFAYDELGRMVKGRGFSATYNRFDLPRTVTRAGRTTTFNYDGLGSRVEKRGHLGAVRTLDGLFAVKRAGRTVEHEYRVPGPDGLAMVLTATSEGASRTYLHRDRLGGVAATSDANGQLVSKAFTTPYGRPVDEAGLSGLPSPELTVHTEAFTGHDWDAESELVDMGGRVYDPASLSFLSRDPVIPGLGGTHGFDGYGYVAARPTRFVDPTGFTADLPEPDIEFSEEEIEAHRDDHVITASRETYDHYDGSIGGVGDWSGYDDADSLAPGDFDWDPGESTGGGSSQATFGTRCIQGCHSTQPTRMPHHVDPDMALFAAAMGTISGPDTIIDIWDVVSPWSSGEDRAWGAAGLIAPISGRTMRTFASMGSGHARDAANAVRLRHQLASQEIASGHAFEKHVVKRGEFRYLGISTREQFASHVEGIMNNPSAARSLRGGRTALWDDATGTVVIRHPSAADGGTAFRPVEGRAYFEGLR